MSDTGALERRIEELETQMAFQEELHTRLNEVVARQDAEIRTLNEQVRDLGRRVREVGDSLSAGPAGPVDETPPHY